MKTDFTRSGETRDDEESEEFLSDDLKYSRAVECWDLPGVGGNRKGTHLAEVRDTNFSEFNPKVCLFSTLIFLPNSNF